MNEQLSRINMYHAQWSVVYYLQKSGTATLVEISAYFDVEKPTITRTVNRLEELGLIQQIHGKDKRERRIQLTDLGVQKYVEGRKIVEQFEKNMLKDILEEDRERTRQILLQLLKNLKGD